MSEFGQRLKVAADQVGGLDALAKATGVKRTTMFDYAGGRTEPKISTVVEIAAKTGVSVEWLATGDGPQRKALLIETEGTVTPRTIPIGMVRKFAWNIAATFWDELPKRTKAADFADQFVEMLDYLLNREDVKDEAAAEVIHFGAERLKRASGQGEP